MSYSKRSLSFIVITFLLLMSIHQINISYSVSSSYHNNDGDTVVVWNFDNLSLGQQIVPPDFGDVNDGWMGTNPAGFDEADPQLMDPGRFGKSLDFDGNDNLSFTISSGLSSENFGIEMWLMPRPGPGSIQKILDTGISDNNGLRIGLTERSFGFSLEIEYAGSSGKRTLGYQNVEELRLKEGAWYYFAMSISNSENMLALVLNDYSIVGDLNSLPYEATTSGNFTFGSTTDGQNHFNGSLDEIRFSKTGRSAYSYRTTYREMCRIGNWKLDGMNEQTILDDSNNGLHGVLGANGNAGVDDPGTLTEGISKNSLVFDKNDLVKIDHHNTMDHLEFGTLDLWYLRKDLRFNGNEFLVSLGADDEINNRTIAIWLNNDTLGLKVLDAQPIIIPAPVQAKWHNLVFTWNLTEARLFLDGDAENSIAVARHFRNSVPSLSPLIIGAAHQGGGVYGDGFQGLIDEINFSARYSDAYDLDDTFPPANPYEQFSGEDLLGLSLKIQDPEKPGAGLFPGEPLEFESGQDMQIYWTAYNYFGATYSYSSITVKAKLLGTRMTPSVFMESYDIELADFQNIYLGSKFTFQGENSIPVPYKPGTYDIIVILRDPASSSEKLLYNNFVNFTIRIQEPDLALANNSVVVIQPVGNSAWINWTTNIPSSDYVRVTVRGDEGEPIENNVLENEMSLVHSVFIRDAKGGNYSFVLGGRTLGNTDVISFMNITNQSLKFTLLPVFIEGPTSFGTTHYSTNISFETNTPVKAQLEYWTEGGAINVVQGPLDYLTSFDINIGNLDANTTFHYRARIQTWDGVINYSKIKDFTTVRVPELANGLEFRYIYTESCNIVFRTTQMTKAVLNVYRYDGELNTETESIVETVFRYSSVDYWFSGSPFRDEYDLTVYIQDPTNKYFYELELENLEGGISIFKDEINIPLSFSSGPEVSFVNDTMAQIVFFTNYESTVQINYGNSLENLNQSLEWKGVHNLSYEHYVNIFELLPEYIYFFQIITVDGFGRTLESETMSFITQPKIFTDYDFPWHEITIDFPGDQAVIGWVLYYPVPKEQMSIKYWKLDRDSNTYDEATYAEPIKSEGRWVIILEDLTFGQAYRVEIMVESDPYNITRHVDFYYEGNQSSNDGGVGGNGGQVGDVSSENGSGQVDNEGSSPIILISIVIVGMIFIIILMIVIFRKKRRSNDETSISLDHEILEEGVGIIPPPLAPVKESTGGDVQLLSATSYQKANLIYKVKIQNDQKASISEVVVTPFVPKDLFIIDKEEQEISLIRGGNAKTATFKLRPRGECGNIDIHCSVKYFNHNLEDYEKKSAKPRPTKIICPMLKIKTIDLEKWQKMVFRNISVDETTEEISIRGAMLFDILSDTLKKMNMFMLEPSVMDDGDLFRGSALFYSQGIKAYGYGVQIEIMGGLRKSKLILKAFAPNDETLIGFYHCILDEIQKRIDIKAYIADVIVQQHFHGDVIQDGGSKVDIRDSVLQRSNIASTVENSAGSKAISKLEKTVKEQGKELGGKQDELYEKSLEISGKQDRLSREMKAHLGKLICELPIPSDVTRKGTDLLLQYNCSSCNDVALTVKDSMIKRWAKVIGLGIASVGSAAIGQSDNAVKSGKALYLEITGKKVEDMGQDQFQMTQKERDDLVGFLKGKDVFSHLHYCPECQDWVGKECWNVQGNACKDHIA